MTQFFFKQDAPAGGNGSFGSPWDQAGFDAALASAAFRVGGLDTLDLVTGSGADLLSISSANANLTPFTSNTTFSIQFTSTAFDSPTPFDFTRMGSLITIENNAGSNNFFVASGSSLTLNAAQASGLTISGLGSVSVKSLQDALGADLTNITTEVFTAEAILTAAATFTGSLGQADVTLTAASGTQVFTVNTSSLQTAGGSIEVGNGAVLATTAGQLQQISADNIFTSGSGEIRITNFVSTAFVDLSTLSGNIPALVTANQIATNGIDLGTVAPSIASGVRLTLADNSQNFFGDTQFNGAGAITWNNTTVNTAIDLRVYTTGQNVYSTNQNFVNNLTFGAGADSIATDDGSDIIRSGAGNDTINAGDGSNVVSAGAGADDVNTGIGADIIEGGGGNDSINAGDGANYVTDGAGADMILAGIGNDTIFSGELGDFIQTLGGEDLIGAGSGADVVFAGDGNDTVIGGGGNDIISGDDDVDNLSGGDGNDQFLVADSAQQVAGDIIAGGAGTNTIGFTGPVPVTAVFDFDNISDVLIINNNGDELDVTRAVTFSAITETTVQTVVMDLNDSDSTGAVTVTNDAASATTTFNITGGTAADTLIGSLGADTITGGDGADTITGGAGNDQFLVADSAQQVAGDSIAGGAGTNTIKFTGAAAVTAVFDFDNISDVLTINNNGDNLGETRAVTFSAITPETTVQTVVMDLNDSTGVVTVTNNAASATTTFNITGGTAADTLAGSLGADTITGGAGADEFLVAASDQIAADIIAGGAGTNTIGFTGAASVTAVFDFDNISDVLLINNEAGSDLTQTRTVTFSAIAETTVQTVVMDLNDSDSTGAVTVTNSAASATTTFNITGGSAADSLVGSNGADTITGGIGDDTITGGAGADSVSGGADDDQFLVAGTGQQVAGDIIAGGGAVTTNTIGFTGAAAVTAEFDFDNISDVLTINNDDDLTQTRTVTFSAITETTVQTVVMNLNDSTAAVTVTNNADTATTIFNITGGSAADSLVGSSGADTITGGAGVDSINGGLGNDTITGNAGGDSLTGGGGADAFTYSATTDGGAFVAGSRAPGDTITDFATTVDDIRLIGAFLTGTMTGTAANAVNAIAYGTDLDLNGAGTGNDTTQLIAAGAATATITDLVTLADLNTALTFDNETIGDERILAFNAGDGSYAIYYFASAAADDAMTAAELTLLATGTTATLVAGDFTFA